MSKEGGKNIKTRQGATSWLQVTKSRARQFYSHNFHEVNFRKSRRVADVFRRIHELQATLSSFVMLNKKNVKSTARLLHNTFCFIYFIFCSFAALLFEFLYIMYWKQFEMTHLACGKLLKIIDLVFFNFY
jgi:hypothetical protein